MKKSRNSRIMARRIPRRRSPRLNNVETRKISCYSKRRTHRIRQRSAEPDASKTERDLFITFQKKPRPVTVASMESVIYLGNYQKIPELVTLDDGSDDESHKTEPYKQKLRSYKNSNHVNFNDAVSNKNNSRILPSNCMPSDNDILDRLQNMHVSTDPVKKF